MCKPSETLSESAGGGNVYAGSHFGHFFFRNGDDDDNSTGLLHWTGPASWKFACLARIDVRCVDEPHDRRNDDLAKASRN